MAEKNRNIRQWPEERYPEPGIPAAEGWKSMKTLLDTSMPSEGKPASGFPLFLLTAAAAGIAGLVLFLISENPSDQSLQSQDNAIATGTPAHQETTKPGTTALLQEPASAEENKPGNNSALSRNTAGRPDSSLPDAGQTSAQTNATGQHPVRSSPSDARGNTIRKNKTKTISPDMIRVISADIDLPAISPDADTTANTPLRLQTLNMLDRHRSPGSSGPQLPVPGFPERSKKPETRDVDTNKKPPVNWGLQWAANFPLAGRETYPEDLKEKYGAYILAIPGIWAGRKIGSRHEVIFILRPYFDYYSKNELFFQNAVLDTRPDSIQTPRAYPENGRLLKLRSSSFTVEYHYRFAGNFLIGGELSQQHNWNALSSIRYLSTPGISAAVDSLEWLSKSDHLWACIRRLNATAGLNLTYRTPSLSLGGSVQMPLFPTSNIAAFSSKPLNARIFIRWQLNPPKKNR